MYIEYAAASYCVLEGRDQARCFASIASAFFLPNMPRLGAGKLWWALGTRSGHMTDVLDMDRLSMWTDHFRVPSASPFCIYLLFSLSLLSVFLLSSLFLRLYHDSLLAMQTAYLIWDVELMWTVECCDERPSTTRSNPQQSTREKHA